MPGQRAWTAALAALLDQVDFLVTPTLSLFPPLLEGREAICWRAVAPSRSTWPGCPALSLPLRTKGPLPASIQLIGPAHSEERLLAAGAALESAAAA